MRDKSRSFWPKRAIQYRFSTVSVSDAGMRPMELSDEIVEELKRLEETLLRPEVRRSREKMAALLADNFMEYGRSGRVYDKAAVLEMADKPFDGLLSLNGFSAKALAPSVALIRYATVLRRSDGNEFHSLRSSIWTRSGQRWQLVFHQGTACGSAKGE